MQYLEGKTWLTLKAATGILDHDVKTRISVEQRAKALVFKKDRRSSPLEIEWKCQISKVNCIMNMSCMHAVSERALQTIISPKGYRTKYLKVVSSHWESFPFICFRNNIMRHFLILCVMSWSLFVCITQQFSASVVTLKP